MSKNKHALINMTIPDAEAQLKRNQVVIIPTGSVEQHGSHLPYGTDWFAANLFAERLSEKIWCPGEQSRWFYERARGQYQVARNRVGTTPARRTVRSSSSTSSI